MKFSWTVGNGPMNNKLNDGDSDHRLASGYKDCFPDSSLLGDTESGQKDVHTDSPDGGTSKTCLGGGFIVPVLL